MRRKYRCILCDPTATVDLTPKVSTTVMPSPLVMFRVQQGPPAPPPINTRFAIINSIYNNPFHWSVFKGLVGFVAGVVIARTVSDEWANSV